MEEKFNLDSIDKTFTRFKVGAKVQATVACKLKNGILLNIGGKKDGFIPFSEEENLALQNINKGDSFEAVIVSTKDESGAVILSKRKADDIRIGNELAGNLHVGDPHKFVVTSATKHGLISKVGTFEVFIPFSQISAKKVDNNLENYVNKQLDAIVLEIDLISHRIVASPRAFEQNEQQTAENLFWNSIYQNKVVHGKVVRFTNFGAFVNVGGVDCLLHNSEASHNKNQTASDVVKLDEERDFVVTSFDKQAKRVALSIKAMTENPLLAKLRQLKVGDVVEGEVKKILPFGAVVVFGDEIEGLLHVKEASHFYVKNVYEVAKVGQKMNFKIIAIDLENCKVSLSLKALQEEPEVVKLANKIGGKANLVLPEAETVYSTDNPPKFDD